MIYVPRIVVEMIRRKNPVVCTKIKYKGYEISISSDSGHTSGDLFRTDIRVYTDPGAVQGVDVTDTFLIKGESMLYGDGETLYRVFRAIDTFDEESRELTLEEVMAGK
jgi:hypothetical protein